MQTMVRGGFTLIASSIGAWIGAAVDHNNWFGFWSNILGVVGFIVGIWLSRKLDDFIEG